MKRWVLVVGGLCLLLFVLGGCGGNSAGSTPTIKLLPGLAQDVDQGQSISYTAAVSDDTSNQGVSWKLTGPNCSGDSCGTFSNTTTGGVTYTAPTGLLTQITVTLTATARVNNTTTATTTINVVLPPTFTTLTLPNGTNGTFYNQTLAVTGGIMPFHYTVVSGSLPAGLALANSGIVQGTPSGYEHVQQFHRSGRRQWQSADHRHPGLYHWHRASPAARDFHRSLGCRPSGQPVQRRSNAVRRHSAV